MKTAIGRRHRGYRAGEDAIVEIGFEARLGGGTYRLALTVTDADGRVPLLQDVAVLALYLAPPLCSAGISELQAYISLDCQRLTAHDAPLPDDHQERDAAGALAFPQGCPPPCPASRPPPRWAASGTHP